MHKFINSLKYSYISIYDSHGLMILYDIHMHLNSLIIITNYGLEYITSTFNINTRKTIHIVCVYRAHSYSIFTF